MLQHVWHGMALGHACHMVLAVGVDGCRCCVAAEKSEWSSPQLLVCEKSRGLRSGPQLLRSHHHLAEEEGCRHGL